MPTSKNGFLKLSPKLMISLAEKRVNRMKPNRRKQRPLYKQEGVVSIRRQTDFQKAENLKIGENFGIIFIEREKKSLSN
jgi:alpha-ketoglutarate-dependent taurine dioxygenase